MDMKALGRTHNLSNGELVRVEVDDDHYYFIYNEDFPEGQFCVSVTHMLDTAAPVGYGLRNFWQSNTKEEADEVLQMTGNRGTKLHQAFDDLMHGLEIDLTEPHWTRFEKDAVTTFIRFFRFLAPEAFKSEKAVASVSLKMAGTLDFVGLVNSTRVEFLLNNSKWLEVTDDGNLQVKAKYKKDFDEALANSQNTKAVIDWKTSAGIYYSHGKQVALYKEMYNESYADEKPVEKKYIWRYSPRHKLGFELKEVEDSFESCMNIYNTYLDINGGELPQPPTLQVYPERVRLLEKK